MAGKLNEIANQIIKLNKRRCLVAIAGPPSSGKSTLADKLCDEINRTSNRPDAVVLPMDGFHLDNELLDIDHTRSRKGAVHTFDFDGFHHMLQRITHCNHDVVIPTFDRGLDLARAGARRIQSNHSIVLIEGNYLLLAEHPWQQLNQLFDWRIFLDVSEDELLRRLQQRWLDHDHTPEQALARAQENDIPNARQVLSHRIKADVVINQEDMDWGN